MDKAFKTCTSCAQQWQEMLDLIRDKDVFINGYQASFSDAGEGLFLFTHNVDGCGTTFGIHAECLKELYKGPKHALHMAFTEKCDGHCLHEDDLDPCPNECAMRWVRDILQILKNHGEEGLVVEPEESSNPEAA